MIRFDGIWITVALMLLSAALVAFGLWYGLALLLAMAP